MTTGYCVKCKCKREISGATHVKLKTGVRALKGHCPKCKTGMCRILGK